MSIRFVALETEIVDAVQTGAPDANGHSPEQETSSGNGTPCRHCLTQVEAGDPFLILAHRPFPARQPYAEQGPIFLHANPCSRHQSDGAIPPMLTSETYIVRGYNAADRIVYGTGKVIPTNDIASVSQDLFADPGIAYIHVRSASNNCYLCRIERD